MLHFANATPRAFAAKYATLGDFPDSWFAGRVAVPLPFHLRARDFVAALARGNDGDGDSARARRARARAARAFWRATVALDDAAEVARQLGARVCVRVPWASLHPAPAPALAADDDAEPASALEFLGIVEPAPPARG